MVKCKSNQLLKANVTVFIV